MKYTLITATGTVMMFYVLALAETYKTIHGGNIVTNKILAQETALL